MRCNQVSIFVERFGEYVPEEYPADVQRIHVYCDDSKSIYDALSKAYVMTIKELVQYKNIGVRTDLYTNEFSRADYRQMHNASFEIKSKYEDDVNLEYGDTRIKPYRDHKYYSPYKRPSKWWKILYFLRRRLKNIALRA